MSNLRRPSTWILAISVVVLAAVTKAEAQPATVSGLVTDAFSNVAIPNVGVVVLSVDGGIVGQGTTNAQGLYAVQIPPGAVYYVATRRSTRGHLAEVHPGIICRGGDCTLDELLAATPFSARAGTTVSGRNFTLEAGGGISGTVTSAANGAALPGVFVTAFPDDGLDSFATGVLTDAAGVYRFEALAPGRYFLTARSTTGFRSEIYDGLPCIDDCDNRERVRAGTPITVSSRVIVGNRNFSLEPGGRITGTVMNASTGQPVQSVRVVAVTRADGQVVQGGDALTNAAGAYTIGGLSAGTYAVYTDSRGETTNRVYDGLLCPTTCARNAAVDGGTPVPVALGATTAGVHITVDDGLSISGRVTREGTGEGLIFTPVFAVTEIGGRLFGADTLTDSTGSYALRGLPAGSYALHTGARHSVNEIFGDVVCPGSCEAADALASGQRVIVQAGNPSASANRNFGLVDGGTITGMVTDAGSGLPIAGIAVEAYAPVNGTFVRVATSRSDTAGLYTLDNVLPGTLRVATAGTHLHRNEVFSNLPCVGPACAVSLIAAGTPVPMSAGGAATANIALSAGDAITGTVTAGATGLPLVGVAVSVYQVPSATPAGAATTDLDGRYVVRGLANGAYVAATANALGFLDEIYDNVRCQATCPPLLAVSSGTRITVSGAAAFAGADVTELVSNIDFGLDIRNQAPAAPTNLHAVTVGFTATFAWSEPALAAGGAATSYVLEAGLTPGTTFVRLPVAGTTFTVPGVPPGTYFVRVRGVNGFGTGPASAEIAHTIGITGVGRPDPPTHMLAFVSGSLLTMTWTAPAGGGTPVDYVVEVGSASGLSNVATIAAPTTVFRFSPVPPGFYFLRVRARNAAGTSAPSAEALVVAGQVPAPPGPPTLRPPVVVGRAVTLAWDAPLQGRATSYVVEAGSAPGLADLAVVNTGSTALAQSFAGVPPGTYYLRIRAVNAQGASSVSNERVINIS